MVKITIVGTGYVGLVTGTCLAEIGHQVICCDISKEKIDLLKLGKIPIYEMGLKELVEKNVIENRLSFTTEINLAILESDVIFSAVGTPPDENHKADLRYVKEVAKVFAQNLNKYKIFVNKSTVPVGTGNEVKKIIEENKINPEIEFEIVSNPEFLREGAAIKDFLNPDRIVIGCENDKAKEIMEKVYKPLERIKSPIIFTDVKSAELIKYAANSMLATRISFINEIANFCDLVGADIKQVAKGIGLDTRIGSKFLQAGIGYGGSCFPKDVSALINSGLENNFEFSILKAVENVNQKQKTIIIEKLEKELGSINGKTISIWGLAFKPRTDDIREAPSIYIIKELLKKGVKIKVFDNIAEKNFKTQHPNLEIMYCKDKYEAIENTNCLLLLTEWDEFRTLDFEKMKEIMKGNLIVDGRNIYDPLEIRKNGFNYIGIGRK